MLCRTALHSHRVHRLLGIVAVAGIGLGTGCPPPMNGDPPDDDDSMIEPVWSEAFDASGVGVLSGVWGSGPSDVFVVGGTPEQGEIYHYDGTVWQAMNVPAVPLLACVFGFGPDDVYAVGEGGGALYYNGEGWQRLTTPTILDLWGVWGRGPDDMWVVGGRVDHGLPVILHFDGVTFTPIAAPANDRGANALFKVWGIGSKVFAVGTRGLIIEYDGTQWAQVPTGAAADDDFVALWGTSESNIVAVGGRSIGQLAVYDGQSWTTQKLGAVPGLNAVYMVDPDQAIVGGQNGYVASYDPLTDTLTAETAATTQTLHAAWGDGQNRFYAVGGSFSEPYHGLALLRTLGAPGIEPQPPLDAPPNPVALEIGLRNGAPYRALEPGGEMPIFTGGQGGFHVFVTIRVTGLPAGAAASLTRSGRLADSGAIVISEQTVRVAFTEVEPGVNEVRDLFVFLNNTLAQVVGREGILSFEVVSEADPTLTASTDLRVVFVDAAGP